MPSPEIPLTLRELVRRRAGYRCEYCQTSEWITGLEAEVDHILPRARGGHTAADNLCLACSSCNAYKRAKTSAFDAQSNQEVALFHPRQQRWSEHFAWSEDGTRMVGQTACGRVTVEALRLNHPLIVAARALWVRTGYHPPALKQEAPAD